MVLKERSFLVNIALPAGLPAPAPTLGPSRRLVTGLSAAILTCALGVAPASAQFEKLSSLIPDFFDRTVVLFPAGHEAHFVDSSELLRDAGERVNSSIVSQLSTFPIGTSAGGFTYEFDEELGIFERSTATFGSVFAERGETIGRGKWNFGFNAFSVEYDAIDSLDLRSGDLGFSLTHLDTNRDGTTVETFFEGDLIDVAASLLLSTDIATFFGNYGVTDRFDLAVAVPLVKVDLGIQLDQSVRRLASEGFSEPAFHRFPDGADSVRDTVRSSASGVGDILVRGKFNLAKHEQGALALAMDVRLPTGDDEDLLGTGNVQTKLFFVASSRFGRFAPHLNIGYTDSGGSGSSVGDLPNEFNFIAGFSLGVHPRVTVFGDLVWRTLLDAQQLEVRQVSHLYKPFDSEQIVQGNRQVLDTRQADLNIANISVGLKVNLVGDLLLSTNLSFSISDEGLRDEDIVPLIGLDYSF